MVFQQGGQNGNFDYFVTANDEADQGWADHNPSRVKQLFGKWAIQMRTPRLG